ncbi:MAG: hypothetical protein ACXVE0_03190, partial [Gaiellaceae bacterium]
MSGKAKTILGAAWAVLVLAVSLSPAPRWLPILLYGFSALLVIVGLLQWYQDRRYAEVQAAQASGFPDISFWFPEASLTGPDADGHHHLTFKGTVTNGEARRVSVSFVLRLKTKSGQISLPIHKPGTYGSLARKPLNIDAHTT